MVSTGNFDRTRLTRRRILTSAAFLGTAAMPLASCREENNQPRRGDAIRFEGWDYESALVQQNVDRFVELNPGIPVDYTPITSAQYIQKIVAEFTAGAEPDALYVYDDTLAGWVDAGYLQSLEGMPGLDEVYDRIYPSNAETMTYNGERYGLPYYTDMQGLVYNERILREAGFDAPPASLDEWEAQAVEIKRQGTLDYPIGLTAQATDTWWAWAWALFFASGQDLFDEDLRPIMATDESPAVDVFEWLRRATNDSQVIDPASLQLLPIPGDNAFMAGEYAFHLAARYGMRTYNDPASSPTAGQAHLAMVPSLDGETEGTASVTRMYCLSAGTKRKEDAYKLISYLGGFVDDEPYTAKFWFEKQGLGFAFEELADDPEIQDELATFVDPDVYERLASVSQPRRAIVEPWYAEFEAALQKTVQQVMTEQQTPREAVVDLADTVDLLRQRYD